MLDKDLMAILACPKCKGEIHYNDHNDGLICDRCHLEYPIRDNIPVMLTDEARSLTD